MSGVKYIGLLFGIVGSLSVSAQSTLNSAGGSKVIAGNTYSWSVGEMSVVNTDTAAVIIVTHGVLQPDNLNSQAVISTSLPGSFEVFPNPAAEQLYLRYQFPQVGILQCTLLDVTGKTILHRRIEAVAGGGTEALNLQDIAAGTYLLQVRLTGNDGATSATTYTIQKLN